MKPFLTLLNRLLFSLAGVLVLASMAPAQQVTVLHTFGDGSVANDGNLPRGALTVGTDGNFYGTTQMGGSMNSGCVFQVTPTGAVTILHSFATVAHDGTQPSAGLALGLDGNFYGTTTAGGSAGLGCVFKITPAAAYTILHNFGDGSIPSDGANPRAGLVLAPDGTFYGTTASGGSSSGGGTIFHITRQGGLTILHRFSDGTVTSDGATPEAPLVLGGDGNLYGTTFSGGSTLTDGSVFKMTPTGVMTILHSFGDGTVTNDGVAPTAGLVQGFDGNFYGTASQSITPGILGVIFKMTPQGTVTVLHGFGDGTTMNDYNTPLTPLVLGTDGNFYGVASAGGEPNGDGGGIYSMTPLGQVTLLHNGNVISLPLQGSSPQPGLTVGANGILYGVTGSDGDGEGTVFQLQLGPPMVTSAAAASGSVSLPFTYQTTNTGSPVTYSATNLPDGLSIDANTGLISGTPTTVETNAATLTLTTSSGAVTFPLTIVIGALPVPAVTSILTSYGSVATAYSYTITGTNNATSFAASGLPGTLTLNSATGVISGMPTTPGTYTVNLTATNATGPSTPITLTIQILAGTPALAQEYNVLFSFQSGTATQQPTSIFQAFDDNFYGATAYAIFKMSVQGVETTFYNFGLESVITSPTSLMQAADGNFYGTTSKNQIFKLTPTAQLSLLHFFANGAAGNSLGLSSLIQGIDGNFYGTTRLGGSTATSPTNGFGMAFRMTPQGVVTVLHNFGDGSVANDGEYPNALVQGSDGNFYGTTKQGGSTQSGAGASASGNGTIFQMTPQGAVTILHSFLDGSIIDDGVNPMAAMVQGYDGNFYGTTVSGGLPGTNEGTIFRITPQGSMTILYTFGTVTDDGTAPLSALIQAYDGSFYGTTSAGGVNGKGALFQISGQGTYTVIHSFGDPGVTNDGTLPMSSSVTQSTAGNFYGVTNAGGGGGTAAGLGTIFSVNAQQTTTHLPIYTGAAAESSAIDSPLSFTPSAAFGVKGSLSGNLVTADQPSGTGIMSSLVSLLPQAITKSFRLPTNWTLGGTLPNELTFNSTSGTISGVATQSGVISVTLTPSNIFGAGAPQTVTLSIDVPPAITSSSTASGTVGTPFSYPITTSNPADFFGATDLPAWLTVDPVLGTITGTPPGAGVYLFNVTAENEAGQMSQAVTLTVTGGSSAVPTITSSTTGSANVTVPFSYQILTANPATSTSALTLPSGLLFNAATGTILGTPTVTGVFQVPIMATNTAGSYATVLSLTVGPPPPPTITSSLIATVAQNNTFWYQIVASPDPTGFGASGLPPGLTYDATTGIISGSVATTGSYPVTITATNAQGTGMATLNINVAALEPYATWIGPVPTPASGPTDMPYNDGIINFFKYFSDISPRVALSSQDRAELPAASTTTVDGTQYLILTYREFALATGFTLSLQTSTDLVNWTTVSPPDLYRQISTDPTTGDPIYEEGVQVNGTGKQFIRLQVTP